MKKVLITGRNSYVGNSFSNWIDENYSKEIEIDKISLRSTDWTTLDFSQYDCIFHVSGLAHSTPTERQKNIYYEINTNLTLRIAEKAKSEGVKQFIFMSSMIVFGNSTVIERINKNSSPKPTGFYGDSKLQAENKLKKLSEDDFKISIIRAPMIYGENSKGNFAKILRINKWLLCFPDIKNKRSLLFVDNLSKFVYLLIKNNDQGVFHPQNNERISTFFLIKKIRKYNNKKTLNFIFPKKIIVRASKRIEILNKLFGSFYYDKELSQYKENYCDFSFEYSIKLIVNKERK